MYQQTDIDKLEKRKLCFDCVGESFLKSEIQHIGKKSKCSYCGATANCYGINQLADRVESVFEEHFIRTPSEPDSFQYAMMNDEESAYSWDREGEPTIYAIMNAADIPEQAASDIQQILEDKFADYDASLAGEETEFSSEAYYEEKSPDGIFWQSEWRKFERSLKSQARFFNQPAAEHLASIFDGIETMQTRDGRPMLVNAGPDTQVRAFYRARVFQSESKLSIALAYPDKHVGPPPSIAAHAGRMNAHGISVFYGANDPMVALAEVRPPVGSQVAVARFEIIRPIRLLDLTALSEVMMRGSVFDPTFGRRLERVFFLRRLSSRITIPVMPDDEALEYLITQAIADFLATGTSVPIDGIIFPSVQAAGEFKNAVLFHKAARVEALELPEGTKVSTSFGHSTEDGWEIDYSVSERVPSAESSATGSIDDFEQSGAGENSVSLPAGGDDERPLTLKIDLNAVKVHIVKAVAFTTDDYDVRRYRWKDSDLLF